MDATVVIAIFQAVIVLLQLSTWRTVQDHENRIRAIERITASMWTRQEHDDFRDKVMDQLTYIRENCPACRSGGSN